MKLTRKQFDALAMEQLDTLYRIARRLTGNVHEAEDLVQETYVRAMRARDGFELESFGIRPWLVRIMHNLHVSRAQRNRRQPSAVQDQQLESAPHRDPENHSQRFEGMDQQVVRAMGSLSRDQQVVLMLWAIEELSYKEIAYALDIPMGTVMSRLFRARQQLSERLRGYAHREGIIRE